MAKTKIVHQVEIIEVFTFEGSDTFGPVLDHLIVIPDQSVMNGSKRTFGNKVFVSPPNFDDIKQGDVAEGVMEMLNLLDEVNI